MVETVHSHRESLGADDHGIRVNSLVQSGSGALYAIRLDSTFLLSLEPYLFHLILRALLRYSIIYHKPTAIF